MQKLGNNPQNIQIMEENAEHPVTDTLACLKSGLKKHVPNTETVVRVYCRLKPGFIPESGMLKFIQDQALRKEGNHVQVFHNGGLRNYSFTRVFDGASSQEDVYEVVGKPMLIDSLFKGKAKMTRQMRPDLHLRC